jgi:cysteine desulfuration protein SufE
MTENTRPVKEIQDEIVEDFGLFDDWTEKYQYIIELGQKMEAFPENERTEQNKIRGCQSNVWMVAENRNGRIVYKADSDSSIVKGLAAMLVKVLSGQRAEEIVNADLKFIDDIGLSQHLAQTRANGLAAMVKQMKLYAIAFQSKVS